MLDAFAHAAQQAGIPATDDFNSGNNEGVGYFEVNQKKGWRWNTPRPFAPHLLPGATTSRCGPARRPPSCWSSASPGTAALHRRAGLDGQGPWSPCAPRARYCCRGRSQLATAWLLLGHRRPSSCASTASTCCTTCPVWAPTCRTTCRSARCYLVQNVKTLNTLASSLVGKARSGWSTRSTAAAP